MSWNYKNGLKFHVTDTVKIQYGFPIIRMAFMKHDLNLPTYYVRENNRDIRIHNKIVFFVIRL